MIERVESTLPTFKALRFKPGLNVLLARKSAGATDRQTRNGAGKTSFVELVHFLLAGSVPKDHFLHSEKLAKATFSMAFDLAGRRVEVERCPTREKETIVRGGDVSSWPCAPNLHGALTREEWSSVLGARMFGIRAAADDRRKFGPTFRSLMPYFARRQSDGGFAHPAKHSDEQQPWNEQVAVSFLLGLDAGIPQELQEVRQREKALREFRRAARDGAFGDLIDKASDLRTQVTVSEKRLAKLREQLATFRVVSQYREYEEEASKITAALADLSNDNHADDQLIAHLNESIASEAPPRFADVRRAYEEAGVVLPGLVVQRFEDVEQFHRSVVENRRAHLSADIEAARGRIAARELEARRLDERRAQLMKILDSGGALEHFYQLQAEAARMESQTESLRRRYEAAETLEHKDAELKIERARLHARMQQDHHEQREVISEAILAFEGLSSDLYERAGSLHVSATPNGPAVEVKISGERSLGISKMQVFCFDMMLMELWARRGGPGFLIHDSHLFDGVDERQAARALEIGAERAERLGFQYIVTMNDDAVPRAALSRSFDLDSHVVPVALTDATDDGGLFGFRFD